MLKRVSMLAGILIILCPSLNVYAEQTDWQLPEKLTNVATQVECEQVPGFYKRPGLAYPDYAFGDLFTDGKKGAVFWCYSGKNNIYNLVILRDGNLFKILEFNNYPGGLSIIKKDLLSLDGFMPYEKNETKTKNTTLKNVTLIKSEYDGVIMYVLWYCNSWYYKILH